jgi:hypothetical protein
MSPQSSTSTTAVQVEDETFVREAADRIRSRMTHSAQSIIEIGRDLIRVKERLGHGNFLPWIDREFRMTEKTAERFMSVAERFGDKFDSVSTLGLTALYELAAPSTPEEVRSEVEARVASGQSVTTAEVKELKSKIRERDDKLNKLRTQKIAADTENRILKRSVGSGDAKIRDLTHQLDVLRGELQQPQQGTNMNHEPVKSALLSLWNVAPEEVKVWFAEFVMKGAEADLNSSPPATAA